MIEAKKEGKHDKHSVRKKGVYTAVLHTGYVYALQGKEEEKETPKEPKSWVPVSHKDVQSRQARKPDGVL